MIIIFLFQNYHNPFDHSATISYQIQKAEFVTVKIFDAISNKVVINVKENKPAGVYEVNFDAFQLSSGIYMYRIVAKSYFQSEKMHLIR